MGKSTGKKFLMAFTGFFLIIFLLVHLSGNLLLLKNDGGFGFNQYAKFLSDMKIMRIIELFLLGGFLLHIFYGTLLTIQNKKARPIGYKVIKYGETSSFFSRFMAPSGGLIFIFIVLHLNTFFVPHRLTGSELSIYESNIIAFKNLSNTIFYVFTMIFLSFHLNHGFQSAFQSLGLNHNKYTPLIKLVGFLFAMIVPFLFAAIPVFIYFKG
jgi:succinate dehydrogenase / fumarate reductase cytochrome b subunit